MKVYEMVDEGLWKKVDEGLLKVDIQHLMLIIIIQYTQPIDEKLQARLNTMKSRNQPL